MKTIAEKHNRLKTQFLYFIIAMLIFLIIILWLKEAAKPKPEPQATLFSDPMIFPDNRHSKARFGFSATHHSVNGVWVPVVELLNPKQEEGE